MFGFEAELSTRQGIAGILLISGAGLVAYGLLRVCVHLFKDRSSELDRKPGHFDSRLVQPEAPADLRSRYLVLVLLLLIVACGSLLRLDVLDAKTLTHTEAIVPNIDLPADISWPPARHSFYDTFWWHFHSEGHPESYYLFMWLWTKIFGVSLTALRIPSAVFGIGCIALVYGIGSLTYDRRMGLLSATLVAFNGFHIYWSQFARMYMMGCFLTLLSTFFLLQIVRNSERRPWWEISYLLVSWIAIYTQTFFWVVLAAQMLWVFLRPNAVSNLTPRTLALQQIIVIVGAASLAHIIYLGDDVTLAGPSLSFVAQYLSFGFLFQPDDLSVPTRAFSALSSVLLLALALLFIIRACAVRAAHEGGFAPAEPFSIRRLLPLASGSALIVLAIAELALRRQTEIAFAALVPFSGMAVVPTYRGFHALLERSRIGRTHGILSKLLRTSRLLSLPFVLAFIPSILILVLSFWTSMLAPRAFLMFVPYLLIVIAAGAVHLSKNRTLLVFIGAALIIVHAASIVHFRSYPTEQRDYAGLGEKMAPHIESGDIIFVVPRLWVNTPLFYYINHRRPTYVAERYAEAVSDRPDGRVWLLYFESSRWGEYGTTNEEMHEALVGFEPELEAHARGSRAVLYTNKQNPAETDSDN